MVILQVDRMDSGAGALLTLGQRRRPCEAELICNHLITRMSGAQTREGLSVCYKQAGIQSLIVYTFYYVVRKTEFKKVTLKCRHICKIGNILRIMFQGLARSSGSVVLAMVSLT